MGYYTRYQLRIQEGDPNLIVDFREENEHVQYAIDNNGNCQEECKWYDSDKDMEAFSKKHPNTLFLLEGEGEESGDIWKQYWRNGKVQTVQGVIIFEPFDESKMINP